MRSLRLNEIAYKIGIRVYCNNCKTLFDPRNQIGILQKTDCKHPASKQRYKSIICVNSVGSRKKRKTFCYDTRNLTEVIELGFQFKHYVKTPIKSKIQLEENVKPILLIDCLSLFLDFKRNIGVKEYQIKTLSQNSFNAFENHIKKWKNATEIIGEDFFQIRVDKVSDDNISETIKHLSSWSTSVQKKAFGFYNQFYLFLIENGYNIVSPFKGIEVNDSIEKEARALTFDEFKLMKDAMALGSINDKIKGKTRFFNWLLDTMDFAALTGRRREEFMTAKFSDITLNPEGKLLGGYIKMIDSKFSKQNSHRVASQNRYTKAPIFPELYDFLMKIGYEKYKSSDRYIIAGEDLKQRNTLADNLTNAFGYYRDKIGMNSLVQLNGLRKKYITRMRNEFGNNANFFTGHKDSRIDKKHYYDDSEIFKKVVKFKLW